MRHRAGVVLALLAVAGCTPQFFEFADWLLPVSEGTPIKEYPPVPLQERDPDAVQLVEDLVIGGELSDPNAFLYEPSALVASDGGNIFVADSGHNHIQMFGPDGGHLKTLGRQGQGPGEFESLSGMTIAGDLLVVDDRNNGRFSTWTLAGEHVADRQKTSNNSLDSMHGLVDGNFVSRFRDYEPGGDRSTAIARFSTDGTELSRLIGITILPPMIPDSTWNARDLARAYIALIGQPRIIEAVGSREIVYVSPVHEYQVLAWSENGDALWALRVAWPRPPFPDRVKREVIDRADRGQEAIGIDAIDWPEHYSAVASIKTDGAGRLYVFPEIPTEGEEATEPRPVDVYSPAGERLAAGFVSDAWSYAAGDYVYGLRADELGERVVVRYRLMLQGERIP